MLPSSSSSSGPQAESLGLAIDASVAAASAAASAILTQEGKPHAVIGGQAVKLLGHSRRTRVCMEAHRVVFTVTNLCRTLTFWWMNQRLP